MTFFVMTMAKTVFTIRFYYFALALYTKTSISDKPILDFTPDHKPKLGSTDDTGSTATPLKTSNSKTSARSLYPPSTHIVL